MVTGPMLLVIFGFSIILLLVLIMRYNWQPFLALLLSGFSIALLSGIAIQEIPTILTNGFGNTLTGIGIVIALGVMLGELLTASGATQRIATSLLDKFGMEKSPLAVALIGYVVSIPVFFDAAFVILISLIKQLSFKTKMAFTAFVTSLSVGLIIAHAMLIPTPGPLVIAENFGVDLGLFFIYGVIATLPAIFTAGYLYPMYLNKKAGPEDAITEEDLAGEGVNLDKLKAMQEGKNMPSSFLSFGLIALPILLILSNTFTNNLLGASDTSMGRFFALIGDKNIALFTTVLLASYFLKEFIKKNYDNEFDEIYVSAVEKSGMILLITGAGGAFGNAIVETGIGDYLISVMNGWNVPIILFAFLFSQILRASIGAATPAMITASATIGPLMSNYTASPILVGLAVGAGAIGLSLPNDSGFWVVNRFSNFDMPDTFKTWTLGGTIGGLTALAMLFILSLFSGILPGI